MTKRNTIKVFGIDFQLPPIRTPTTDREADTFHKRYGVSAAELKQAIFEKHQKRVESNV